jgi:membrane fusion protein (multidrug efflux system)
VQLTFDLKNALIIPQKATFEVQDKMYVYVIDQNNIVKTRPIVIKQKISNIYIIESGIQSSEKILLEGIQSVKEDEKIESIFVSPQQALILINKQ